MDRWQRLYAALYALQLRDLPNQHRRALALVEVEGCSYADAAERLGIAHGDVRRVVFEGRSRIHAGMDRAFQALEARIEDF